MRHLFWVFFLFITQAGVALAQPGIPVDPLKPKNPSFAFAQKGDWVQGNPNAKVTVTEYASLSCSHCAAFHQNVYPTIARKYIATHKIQFIYRDFPLNAPALRAAMLLRCQPEEKRGDLLKTLYQTQEKWASNQDFETHLRTLAMKQGISKKAFRQCMENKALEESVVKSRMEGAQQLAVSGTPAIYINGERYQGAPDAESLAATIDKYLAASAATETAKP